ncbi:MAG TPA: threonine/serine dehydratase [Thermodesulfobacteriota bacterium]
MPVIPGPDDVLAAAERLAPHVVTTPLLESPLLDARVGGRLLLKAEMLQRTGAFKWRGAMNRLLQLSDDERRRGVVAFSSGNHGQAVAAAARRVGTSAVVVMPADAPRMKVDRTRAHGAEVVLYDRLRDDREAIGRRLAAERGLVLVPPYDDPMIAAGQGTLALEVARQASGLGARLDAFLVPCSGGGLAAGCALALERESPGTEVYTVEPAGFDDMARSLAEGRRVENRAGGRSICDALLAAAPGEMTFEVNRPRLAGGLVVSDEQVLDAMAAAFDALKVVVEPGGAVALAAALSGALDCRGKTVAVVLSGGNVDPETFARALSRSPA